VPDPNEPAARAPRARGPTWKLVARAAVALKEGRVALAVGRDADGTKLQSEGRALLQRAHGEAEAALLKRLAGWRDSPECALQRRLHGARPSGPARLDHFSLLRRYGRGAHGVVVAARKEDSGALFALKIVLAPRRQSEAQQRAVRRLRHERDALVTVAGSGSPFLPCFCYAVAAPAVCESLAEARCTLYGLWMNGIRHAMRSLRLAIRSSRHASRTQVASDRTLTLVHRRRYRRTHDQARMCLLNC
jgi:hypothetical protein